MRGSRVSARSSASLVGKIAQLPHLVLPQHQFHGVVFGSDYRNVRRQVWASDSVERIIQAEVPRRSISSGDVGLARKASATHYCEWICVAGGANTGGTIACLVLLEAGGFSLHLACALSLSRQISSAIG